MTQFYPPAICASMMYMNMEFPPGSAPKKDAETQESVKKTEVPQNNPGRGLRNFGRALLFGLGATAATEKTAATTPSPLPAEGHEIHAAVPEKIAPEHTADFSSGIAKDTSGTEQHGLKLYTESKTEAGAITPTGYNNSFYENEQKISPEDILEFAKEENLPTDDNFVFQKALQEKYPEIVKSVLEKYGQTNANDFVDGLLGLRVKKVIDAVREKRTETSKEQHTTIYDRFGGNREPLHFGGHTVAQLWFPTAESHSADDAGTINTAFADKILIRFVDEMGKFTGKDVVIAGSEQQKYTGGTQSFLSEAKYHELLSMASDNLSESQIANYKSFADHQ
jgi:hypothetical protein